MQQVFESALAHHRSGRLAEAEALYRQILAVDPRQADVLHYLGVIAHQRGQHEAAVELIRQAIVQAPGIPGFHSNLGLALFAQSRIDEAIAAYRRAIILDPICAEACYNLGNALHARGRSAEAIAAYRQAIALRPHYPAAYDNLGTALRHTGAVEEAISAHRQAIALRPQDPKAHYNLANALRAHQQLDEATAAYRQAIALHPDFAAAHLNLGNALKDGGRLDEAIPSYRRAVALAPSDSDTCGSLFYALLFHPADDSASLREELRHWHQQFAAPLRAHHRPHANDRDPERRLRIGYVSPDFSFHVIGHFLAPLLECHDHAQFAIHCYSGIPRPDAMTDRLRKTADGWREVCDLTDHALAERIREDRIDILVDLTQHMAGNRLLAFARRPAPVQVAWLGYPGSTGLEAMDYRLTDAWMEPEGAAWAESVETPVRLPDSWFCFDPIQVYPEPGPLPALAAGHVTFGSLNHFGKINEPVLQVWAAVLRAVDGSCLLMQCPAGAAQARVWQWFAAAGIATHRIELIARTATRAEFLRLFDRIDIALEPFPYNGGTTTCEALWMGIPVPTFPGSSAVSRIGLSILSAVGLPELIAASPADYVRLTASLAADLPRLGAWRSTLRARMKASAFMDAPRFAGHVEHAYRQMWRAWCGRRRDSALA